MNHYIIFHLCWFFLGGKIGVIDLQGPFSGRSLFGNLRFYTFQSCFEASNDTCWGQNFRGVAKPTKTHKIGWSLLLINPQKPKIPSGWFQLHLVTQRNVNFPLYQAKHTGWKYIIECEPNPPGKPPKLLWISSEKYSLTLTLISPQLYLSKPCEIFGWEFMRAARNV